MFTERTHHNPKTSHARRAQDEGFSEAMIDRFFRPFLGGIFFDTGLSVTSRLFQFVMRVLATGSNCLPAAGIGAVAEQLAAQLPPGSIRTGAQLLLWMRLFCCISRLFVSSS